MEPVERSAWYPGGICALLSLVKFTSALVTAASGSIGGMTASRNRGGQFLRARVIPVNPNTERQGQARANLAQAVNAWTNILTDGNRQAWTSYALATPVVDRLGQQLILSGQQMFVKCSLPRLIADLPLILPGPVESGLATTPTWSVEPTMSQSAGLAGSVSVSGAGTAGDVIIYMAEPLPTSRTIAHSKRAFAGVDGPPVADVFTIAIAAEDLPYFPVQDLQTRVTAVYLGDDGRVSAEAFRDLVVTGGG